MTSIKAVYSLFLAFALFLNACTTEKVVEKEAEIDHAALRDSVYKSLKDSILGDFGEAGYDSLLEDSVYKRLYSDFYNSEMEEIQSRYDSILDARILEMINSQDSLITAKDSATAAHIDSLREELYDSLYNEVYDELYSASALTNIVIRTYGYFPTIHPAAYPYQDSIYQGSLDYQLAYVTVENIGSKEPYWLILRAKVPGFTEEGTITVALNPGDEDTLWVHPALAWSQFTELAEIQKTQINMQVAVLNNERESTIWQTTSDIDVEPMNFFPPQYALPGGGYPNTWPLLVEWVQNSGDSISQVVSSAVALHANHSLNGYQNPAQVSDSVGLISAQVKALYMAIQDRAISYIAGPISPTGQRVRLPEQTLRSKAANCLDGTILFATALEAIGLHPIIVVIPGHSFLGWKVWKDSSTLDFVETTMAWSGSSFEDAVDFARNEFQEETNAGNFSNGNSYVLDVVELHHSGIFAFPVQLSF